MYLLNYIVRLCEDIFFFFYKKKPRKLTIIKCEARTVCCCSSSSSSSTRLSLPCRRSLLLGHFFSGDRKTFLTAVNHELPPVFPIKINLVCLIYVDYIVALLEIRNTLIAIVHIRNGLVLKKEQSSLRRTITFSFA